MPIVCVSETVFSGVDRSLDQGSWKLLKVLAILCLSFSLKVVRIFSLIILFVSFSCVFLSSFGGIVAVVNAFGS